jgi:hypothetical protein
VLDSQRDDKYTKSAKLFINLAKTENNQKFDYIINFEIENLELYKVKKEDFVEEEVE